PSWTGQPRPDRAHRCWCAIWPPKYRRRRRIPKSGREGLARERAARAPGTAGDRDRWTRGFQPPGDAVLGLYPAYNAVLRSYPAIILTGVLRTTTIQCLGERRRATQEFLRMPL